jgi:hypothetical protein
MSLHYLVDLFANPLSSAKIIDVNTVQPASPSTLVNGALLIRVPDGVAVQKPVDYTDLVTQKHLGLLAFYAGFPNITFDDLQDALHVNPAAAGTKGTFGARNSISVYPGGILTSTVIPLTGPAPNQAVITWETYEDDDSDALSDRFTRVYTEVASTPSNITCQVSFNGGATFNSTTDGSVISIPPADQGTNFVIKFTNAFTSRLSIGSWAVLY